MPNSNNPLPPFQPPQPGDVSVSLADPNEKSIQGFQYNLGPLPPPPSILNVLKAGQHFEYSISKTVYQKSGLRCTPVCGSPGTPPVLPTYFVPGDPFSQLLDPGTPGTPGTPMSVTRETAPWGRMAVRWRAARNNGNPVLPSTDLGDVNLVFDEGWILYNGPGLYPDGTKAQVIEGLYTFWLRVPYTELDGVLTAHYPGSDDDIEESLIKGVFSNGIIGPNLPPAAAGTLSAIKF